MPFSLFDIRPTQLVSWIAFSYFVDCFLSRSAYWPPKPFPPLSSGAPKTLSTSVSHSAKATQCKLHQHVTRCIDRGVVKAASTCQFVFISDSSLTQAVDCAMEVEVQHCTPHHTNWLYPVSNIKTSLDIYT